MKYIFKKYSLFITICLIAMPSVAIDSGTLDVGSITGKDWQLEDVKLEVNKLNQNKKTITMTAARLTLPEPYKKLTLANIHCDQFIWEQNNTACLKGRTSVKSAFWQTLTTNFSFKLTPNKVTFNLYDIHVAGSRLMLAGEMVGAAWQVKFKADHITNDLVDKLLKLSSVKTKSKTARQGLLNLDGTISGRQQIPLAIEVTAKIDGLTDQTQDGKVATEKLSVLTHFVGTKSAQAKHSWLWQSESKLLGGAVYVDPVYVDVGAQPIALTANGLWYTRTNTFDINHFTYQHPNVGQLTGSVAGSYRDKVMLNTSNLVLTSDKLQALLSTYVNPYFTESPFTGMAINGHLDAKLAFTSTTLTHVNAQINSLNVDDEAGRVKLEQAAGLLNWSSDPRLTEHSQLHWQGLSLKGIPIQAAKLAFTSHGKRFNLAQKVNLPVLNGNVNVDQFSWQSLPDNEPEVSFAGSINDVSLEQLSKALGWTALSGNISGQIPGVSYQRKTLSLGGGLLIKVFDGEVKINNLTSRGVFSDFPKVSSDIEITNLDLEKLTSKFEFGNITGKLTGFVKKLELENWQPVSFYAWLGTPEDDDSAHKISQKAVNNIAQIGGGGAADALSRSFLSFFDTFRYDNIGVGCYLHNGVCQMMGLEANEHGYYLIKGSYPPRIDVLGYNTEVNWDVLVERLKRVAAPDKVIVD